MRTFFEVQDEIAALDARIDVLRREGLAFARRPANLDAKGDFNAGALKAAADYQAGIDRLMAERGVLREEMVAAQRALIASNSREPLLVERGGVDLSTPKENPVLQHRSAAYDGRGYFAAASQAIGTLQSPRAMDKLDAVLRSEPVPALARWIAAASSPHYATAFAKVMSDPERAILDLTDLERAAWNEGRGAVRAMDLSDPGSLGGYMVPFHVDPTLVLSDDGAVNPIRQLATVRTLTGPGLYVVTTSGVVAEYRAEGDDIPVADPTLLRPRIKAEQASAAVQVSFEAFDDIASIQTELGRAFSAAKDALEAEKFAHGLGEIANEPSGIIAALTPMGGTPAAVVDLIVVQGDLGARWQANARWLMDVTSRNEIDQLVAEADADQAKITGPDGILHKPVTELSTADGNIVYGDIRAGYLVVDRLGMRVEVVPHLPGATPGSIAGYRALLARWRSGGGVAVPEALRLIGTGS